MSKAHVNIYINTWNSIRTYMVFHNKIKARYIIFHSSYFILFCILG